MTKTDAESFLNQVGRNLTGGKGPFDDETKVSHVENITFAGTELDCIQDPSTNEIYVSLHRACEGIGIDYSSQRSKLDKMHWATLVMITTVAKDGKYRDLTMIDLDTLAMWLATLQVSRINEEARPNVIAYQKECVKVIREHFMGKPAAPPAEIHPVDQPLLEREVRHPDGRVVIERYARPHDPAPDIASLEYEEEFEDLTPQVSVDVLRKRFHRAANQELRNVPEYRRLSDREQRATFCRKLNSQLKAFIGRERAEWTALDYHNAVNWLVMQYGLDVRWILEPLDNVVELGGER